MKILIQHGHVMDPASGINAPADVAVADGKIVAVGEISTDFHPDSCIDASHSWVLPGLVDACTRLGEPGHEHEGMLHTELVAAVAGGVTSVVCMPDTQPVLDEPGLVEMLKFRAERLHLSKVFPLGALTRGLQGEVLTPMAELTQAGCIGFTQAEKAIANTQGLQRAMQYAATFGFCVWLRAQDSYLGQGMVASGPLATRMGLSGVPVAAETIALHTYIDLMRITGARVHISKLSSAAGVELVRAAKAEGLPLSCDVSIHNLHFTDTDIGYFDTRARLTPPLRQQLDRQALGAALADGTIDALVSDHTPVEGDSKALPFAQAEPGATGLELLLSASLKWAIQHKVDTLRAIDVISRAPATLLGQAVSGRLQLGGAADICIVAPQASWQVMPENLRSQCKHTPFAFDLSGSEMTGQVKATLVDGRLAYQAPGLF